MCVRLLDLEESIERRLSGATGFGRRRGLVSTRPHLPLSLCHPPLPPLTWALPLAERWDSFTEAGGCQERESPRKAGQMYVGHCESEGGFSFSSSLLFSPPFCSFVLFGLFGSLLAPPPVKSTLICVNPVRYSPNEPLRQGPIRYGDVSYWLINFSLCAHTSLSVSLCVWLVFLTHGQTNALREGDGLH